MRLVILAGSLALSASIALAFPIIPGNSADKAKVGITFDSMAIAANNVRTAYLIQPAVGGVRSNLDSLVTVWRAGGATPRLRRMQHLWLWHGASDGLAAICFDMTVFRDGATSLQRLCLQPFNFINVPLEADSIRFTARGGTVVLSMAYW